jgi:hypothetical protein
MTVTQLFLAAFGMFWLLFMSLLGRQILRHEISRINQRRNALGSAEGTMLLAMTTITGTKYCLELIHTSGSGSLPGLAREWIAAFAISCAVYVVTKALRVLRIHSR